MLKYVALMKVEYPTFCSQVINHFKSPITDKKSAEKWLSDELKKYPDASINKHSCCNTTIYTAIIAFDDQESKNVEQFMENWIH